MHVAQILLSPRIGGAESLASSLSATWSKVGISSEIIYLDASMARKSRVSRLFTLRAALRRPNIDVVLSHSAIPNLYARLVAKRSIPVVTVLHSASDDFASLTMRLIERALARRTSAVVAVSDSKARQYAEHFGHSRQPYVIANGIREDLPIKTLHALKPRSVLTMARVAAQKDPALWAETARILRTTHTGLELEWWGPFVSEPSSASFVQTHNEQAAPGIFRGPTSDPVPKLLAADILFHPSAREAHSIALLEAAAIGLPIVCSYEVAQTSIPDLASATFHGPDGKSGAEAVADVVRDWENATQNRSAVAAQVRNQYGMGRCAALYAELFARLLQPKHR